jgi:O-ureido-D-serine cyclo-ligase
MANDSTDRRGLPHIALVTAAAARGLDEDLPPLENALRTIAGLRFSVVDWDDAAVDWSAFDAAVLRSTWDYSQRLEEFLDWARRAAAATQLLNPLAVVRWNTDKHYLHELAQAGVATVPSAFIEPGHDAAAGLRAFLREHATVEFVVKPAIGAGSRDAQRYAHDEQVAALVEALCAELPLAAICAFIVYDSETFLQATVRRYADALERRRAPR